MIDREITITIEPRPGGGIRVHSDEVPGLILSGQDFVKVLNDIGPALVGILAHSTEKL